MKVHIFVICAALGILAALTYWLYPPRWMPFVAWPALALAIGSAVLALIRLPQRTSRRGAAAVLLATFASVVLLLWLNPVPRLRIALSADALAGAAVLGPMTYDQPKRIGLFDVKAIRPGDGTVNFDVEEGCELDGWKTTLRASIAESRGSVPVLENWTWMTWAGLRVR